MEFFKAIEMEPHAPSPEQHQTPAEQHRSDQLALELYRQVIVVVYLVAMGGLAIAG